MISRPNSCMGGTLPIAFYGEFIQSARRKLVVFSQSLEAATENKHVFILSFSMCHETGLLWAQGRLLIRGQGNFLQANIFQLCSSKS